MTTLPLNAPRGVAPSFAVALCACLLGAACQRAPSTERREMITLAAATLLMGCDPARDPGCAPDELPRHPVEVRGFRIDRTEVTQADYAACLAAARCTPPSASFEPAVRPRAPVTNVTWEQARAYCRWRGKRLPTEAEWELAARGPDGPRYPWGDTAPTCEQAHTRECGERPADVGGRPAGASPFGVLDLAGNVDEWVDDEYAPYADPARRTGERTARGGAYDAWHSRATARSALQPDARDAWLGFRCAAAP